MSGIFTTASTGRLSVVLRTLRMTKLINELLRVLVMERDSWLPEMWKAIIAGRMVSLHSRSPGEPDSLAPLAIDTPGAVVQPRGMPWRLRSLIWQNERRDRG